jgi:hypothetical protein
MLVYQRVNHHKSPRNEPFSIAMQNSQRVSTTNPTVPVVPFKASDSSTRKPTSWACASWSLTALTVGVGSGLDLRRVGRENIGLNIRIKWKIIDQ